MKNVFLLNNRKEERKLQKALSEAKTARECLAELSNIKSLYGRNKNKKGVKA